MLDRCSDVLSRLLSKLGWLILHLGTAGSGRALGPLSFWFVWQWITDRYYRLKPIRAGGMLRYRLVRFKGRTLELADGAILRPGDLIVDLHIDSKAVAKRLSGCAEGKQASARTWLSVKWCEQDLTALAKSGPVDSEVKAVYGMLVLAGATKRLGFEVRPLPRNRWNDLVGFFMLGLLTIYNPVGRERLPTRGQHYYPAEIWMSRDKLIRLYGSKQNGHI